MTTTKEKAIYWIRSMPDDCTLDEIRYQLYFREQIDEGLKAIEEDRVIPHEEVKRRTAQWLAS